MSADLEPYQAPATPALKAGPLDYPTVLALGKAFATSGLFPGVKDQGVAVVKILAGAEFGLEPVSAMNHIDIIATKDRPPRLRLDTDAQTLLAARAGYTFRPVEHTEQKCVLEWSKNGKMLGTSEFSVAQAQRARLVRDGGAWQAWPMNMTLARAITQGIKLYCRHVLAGSIGGMAVVTTEELEQEYPDPRDDLMRALFATYRERFPMAPGEDPDAYREQRLEWSAVVLGREQVPSWNGPEAPETLTRADVQTLLDALQDTQAAPDPGPAAPALSADPSGTGADHTQGSAGSDPREAQQATAGQGSHSRGDRAPVEQTETPGAERVATQDMPAVMGSRSGGPSATTRKRTVAKRPTVAQGIQEAQGFRDGRREQVVIETPITDPVQSMVTSFSVPFHQFFGGDQKAARAEVERHVEKWKSEGTWPAEGKFAPWGRHHYLELAADTFEAERYQ